MTRTFDKSEMDASEEAYEWLIENFEDVEIEADDEQELKEGAIENIVSHFNDQLNPADRIIIDSDDDFEITLIIK